MIGKYAVNCCDLDVRVGIGAADRTLQGRTRGNVLHNDNDAWGANPRSRDRPGINHKSEGEMNAVTSPPRPALSASGDRTATGHQTARHPGPPVQPFLSIYSPYEALHVPPARPRSKWKKRASSCRIDCPTTPQAPIVRSRAYEARAKCLHQLGARTNGPEGAWDPSGAVDPICP